MQLTKVDIAALIVVGVLLVWQDARADKLLLHGGSKHYGDTQGYDFNESNSGVGYQHDITPQFAVIGGVYDNSYNRTSVYAGAAVTTNPRRTFSVGLQGGIVTGYDDTPQGTGVVTGYVLPFVRARRGLVFAEIGWIPPLTGIGAITYSVGVSW